MGCVGWKKKKNVEEVASGRAVSLASLRICKKCPAGGSRERMSGLRGMRHLKGVRDLGSCKLRPGDFQAVVVRKRFHKGSYNVSILSPRPLSWAPGQLHSHPFQAPPPLWQYAFLSFGQGHPYCPSHLSLQLSALAKGGSCCQHVKGRRGQRTDGGKGPKGRDPTCQGWVTLIQGLRAVEAHTDISHKSLRTHTQTHNSV